MGQAPPTPQLSPDGRFWWDGQGWQPMPPATAQAPASRSYVGRNLAIAAGGFILVVVILAAVGASQRPPAQLDMTVAGAGSTTGIVGHPDGVVIHVTDNGADQPDVVLYLNGGDNWLNHHVIVDAGSCTLNKSLGRLDCGKISSGQTMDIRVAATPKDAGNFDFAADVAVDSGSSLSYPKLNEITWSEAVTP